MIWFSTDQQPEGGKKDREGSAGGGGRGSYIARAHIHSNLRGKLGLDILLQVGHGGEHLGLRLRRSKRRDALVQILRSASRRVVYGGAGLTLSTWFSLEGVTNDETRPDFE